MKGTGWWVWLSAGFGWGGSRTGCRSGKSGPRDRGLRSFRSPGLGSFRERGRLRGLRRGVGMAVVILRNRWLWRGGCLEGARPRRGRGGQDQGTAASSSVAVQILKVDRKGWWSSSSHFKPTVFCLGIDSSTPYFL